jgi:hypothetical protein
MLERFHSEVTESGTDACLPRNLSDEWLESVAKIVDAVLLEPEEGEQQADLVSATDEMKAIALAAVLSILSAKCKQPSIEVSMEELLRCLCDYQMELALEVVHRRTDIRYEAASLETIFTNRDVRTWKEPR